MQPEIRESRDEDRDALLALSVRAFPDEDLRPLVAALLDCPACLSLCAMEAGAAVGHAVFTRCDAGALLGPVAVAPERQRAGLGSTLLRDGLERLRAQDVAQVFVLGDPAYYRRFGFTPERAVTPPYPIPEAWADAWRSLRLGDRAPLAPGALRVPAPWRDPALWSG